MQPKVAKRLGSQTCYTKFDLIVYNADGLGRYIPCTWRFGIVNAGSMHRRQPDPPAVWCLDSYPGTPTGCAIGSDWLNHAPSVDVFQLPSALFHHNQLHDLKVVLYTGLSWFSRPVVQEIKKVSSWNVLLQHIMVNFLLTWASDRVFSVVCLTVCASIVRL